MSEIKPANWPSSWLTPDWPAPPGVHAVCTSREGGVSQAPWGSLNLGDHVGDDMAHVTANRARLTQALAAQTEGACNVYLQQIHGVDAVQLNAASAQGQAADACATDQAGVACTIMVADCLPVLFAHQNGKVVAAAHAGWRGLAGMPPGTIGAPLKQGVLEKTFELFSALEPANPVQAATDLIVNDSGHPTQITAQTLVWLGPCIGPEAFEVGAEVRAAFIAHDAAAAEHFTAVPAPHASEQVPQKYLANLAQLARQRLRALGITAIYGNDGSPQWCTVSNAVQFFSHRRDAASLGSSGRFAACIWRG